MQRKTEAAHPILCRFGFVTHGRAKEGSRGVLCQVTDTLRQEVGDPDFWVQNLGNSVFGLQIPSFASSEDWSNNSNGTYDVQIRAEATFTLTEVWHQEQGVSEYPMASSMW